jgi:hypothetical protein
LLGREAGAVEILVGGSSADAELSCDVGRPETVGPRPADLGDLVGIQRPPAFIFAGGLGSGDALDLALPFEVVFELREHPE